MPLTYSTNVAFVSSHLFTLFTPEFKSRSLPSRLSRPFIHTFIKNVLSSSSPPAIMVEETSTVKERVMTPALWRLWASWEIHYWSRNHTNEREKNSNYGQWRKPVTWGFRGIRSNLHSQRKTPEWWIQDFARWGGEGRALPADRGRMRSKH